MINLRRSAGRRDEPPHSERTGVTGPCTRHPPSSATDNSRRFIDNSGTSRRFVCLSTFINIWDIFRTKKPEKSREILKTPLLSKQHFKTLTDSRFFLERLKRDSFKHFLSPRIYLNVPKKTFRLGGGGRCILGATPDLATLNGRSGAVTQLFVLSEANQ